MQEIEPLRTASLSTLTTTLMNSNETRGKHVPNIGEQCLVHCNKPAHFLGSACLRIYEKVFEEIQVLLQVSVCIAEWLVSRVFDPDLIAVCSVRAFRNTP